jgi:hypothetical protein
VFGRKASFHGDDPAEDGVQVRDGEPRSHPACLLRTLEQVSEGVGQLRAGCGALGPDASAPEGAGQRGVLPGLGGEIANKAEEDIHRLLRVAEHAGTSCEAGQPIGHHGCDQRFLGREVTVDRPRAHLRTLGDDIEGYVGALARKGRTRSRENLLTVAAGVGPQRAWGVDENSSCYPGRSPRIVSGATTPLI